MRSNSGRIFRREKATRKCFLAGARLQKLSREFERGGLEIDAPWRVREHETEVDVNDVAVTV